MMEQQPQQRTEETLAKAQGTLFKDGVRIPAPSDESPFLTHSQVRELLDRLGATSKRADRQG